MSSYEQMVTTTISLETSPLSRTSFGIPLFIGAHAYFTERVRVYNNIAAVGGDFPADSDEYKAATAAFSADPRISQLKIGRRQVDSVQITPDASTSAGQVYTISVLGTDGLTTTASVTTAGGESQATLAASLSVALNSVTGVSVTAAGNVVTLARTGVDNFSLSNLKKVSVNNITTEDAGTLLQEIEEEDNDWYFVGTHDHSDAFITAFAAAIEARKKEYWVTQQEVDNIGTLVDPPLDLFGQLQSDGYLRTSTYYHDQADELFPEMAYIGILAAYDPGKSVVANNKVEGAGGAARSTSDGKLLTTTQKNNLTQRNANFVETTAGVNITSAQSGKMAGNEWADVIRNRDFLEARITEAFQFFMINNPVVPHTQPWYDALESVLSTELSRYVETDKQPHILRKDNPFEIRFPRAKDVSALTKATRVFTGEFDAYLAGAIQIVKITGTLQYGEQ